MVKREGSDLLPEKESKFLAKMMEHHQRGNKTASYEQLRKELNIGNRVASQQNAWKNLMNEGYIEVLNGGAISTGDFQLTAKGMEYAATPEYKEYIKDLDIVSATNEDHQARIKKHLNAGWKNRGIQIFDLLAKHGSLTAVELAALADTKRGSHGFSYALKELKDKGYVEVDPAAQGGKKLRLSDKAFLNASEDRTTPETIASDALKETVEKNAARKRSPKAEKGEKAAKACKERKGKKAEDSEGKVKQSEVNDGENVKQEEAVTKDAAAKKEDNLEALTEADEVDTWVKVDNIPV